MKVTYILAAMLLLSDVAYADPDDQNVVEVIEPTAPDMETRLAMEREPGDEAVSITVVEPVDESTMIDYSVVEPLPAEMTE